MASEKARLGTAGLSQPQYWVTIDVAIKYTKIIKAMKSQPQYWVTIDVAVKALVEDGFTSLNPSTG